MTTNGAQNRSKTTSLLSDKALGWLARWFNKVEEICKWPEDQKRTRAVLLSKDPAKAGDPMAYRMIKITSALYRIWGAVRMKDLDKWIERWTDPAFFAGVPGVGAEEAWYSTALDIEQRRSEGKQVTVGSIDVYKCFDQVVRKLVVGLAEKAGMPSKILRTYEGYVESKVILIQIGDAFQPVIHAPVV